MTSVRRRVLVTGASGFVGQGLVQALSANPDFDVHAAVRTLNDGSRPEAPSAQSLSDGGSANVPRTVAMGDLAVAADRSAALTDVDTVVHLAARVHVMHDVVQNPLAEFRRVNVDATLNLARQAAASGVRRMVYLSSIKVHGEQGVFSERDDPAPVDAYAVSKLEAEVGLREIASSTGLEVVIIRPPLIYGHGAKANFRALIRLVQRGVPLPFGAIHNRRSFVALDNLVDMIITCVRHPRAAGETFLVTDGHDLSTTELLRQVGAALGKPARLVPVPEWMLQAAFAVSGRRGMADRLLGTLCADISKARAVLQWSPPVSVAQAMQRTVLTP